MSRRTLLVSPDGPFPLGRLSTEKDSKDGIKWTTCRETVSHRLYFPQHLQQYSQKNTHIYSSFYFIEHLPLSIQHPVAFSNDHHSLALSHQNQVCSFHHCPTPQTQRSTLSEAAQNPPCRKSPRPSYNSSYLAKNLPSPLAVRLKIRIDTTRTA
ncbi:hypothetical protein BDR22DRAFT_395394 [Usnea florida]